MSGQFQLAMLAGRCGKRPPTLNPQVLTFPSILAPTRTSAGRSGKAAHQGMVSGSRRSDAPCAGGQRSGFLRTSSRRLARQEAGIWVIGS